MAQLSKVEAALQSLNERITKFPIGAVVLDDFKPIEEKVKDVRASLKPLNSQLLMLQARLDTRLTSEPPEQSITETLDGYHQEVANFLINDRWINLCLHSCGIQDIVSEGKGSPEMGEKLHRFMRKLFSLNDAIITLHREMESELRERFELELQCRSAFLEYQNFLKEQRELKDKRLWETNPEIAENKKKMERTLRKINIMKRLMTNMIAAAHRKLREKPILAELLEQHTDLVNIETILEMSRNEFVEDT